MSDVQLSWPRDEVALLTFDRPETLNALTRGLVDTLGELLVCLESEGRARVVILTGAGRGFSSGHDLGELTAEAAAADVGALMENQRAFAGLIVRIKDLRIPVVAAVNGPAAGAGMALALAADTRVCDASARFSAAFVKLGISGCDVGVSHLLPRLVGPTLAFEMMLTGRLIDANEALRSGLVLQVVPDGQVVDAALEIATAIIGNDRFGIEMTKELMWANLHSPDLASSIIAENRTQALCLTTPAARDAIRSMRQTVGSRATTDDPAAPR